MKHCTTCQNFHKEEFEDLCRACLGHSVLVNYCPKISIFKSFISPFAIPCLILMGLHLLGLIYAVQGAWVPILVSLGLWFINYIFVVLNDISWRFSMYKLKQHHKMRSDSQI